MASADEHLSAEEWRQRAGRGQTPRRRPLLKLGTDRPRWSSVEPLADGYLFVWIGWLPKISGHQVNRFARSRLCKLARVTFGVLPPAMYPMRRARVEVLRVLGPGQKPMDPDSLGQLCAGLIDALQPSYLRTDSEKWSDIVYRNDGSRRQAGPMIELRLVYERK
jgi:hypothetical protein